MEPNLDGFAEAQQRLTEAMGDSVVLLAPLPTIYPPGTKLDPETQEPQDPWVIPLSSGWASATVKASVAFRPLRSSNEAENAEGPLGIKGTLGGAAIFYDSDDWPLAEKATRLRYADREYAVEDRISDHNPLRVVVYFEPL